MHLESERRRVTMKSALTAARDGYPNRPARDHGPEFAPIGAEYAGTTGTDQWRLIRALVLSEIRLHREGLASRLAGQPWIELVGSAGTMSEAVRLAIDQHVDVVLLDLPPTRDN